MENFGKYTIEKQIGEGGTASVYLAKDTKLNRNVALKIMSNQQLSTIIDFKKLLIDEAQRTAKLNHPHIIQIYEVGSINDNIYIAMEYLAGGTLKDRTSQQQFFDPLKVMTDITKALHYAYTETATIHRDIKPANIIFRQHTNGDLDAVLTDFGISKTEGTDSDFTSFDLKVGTPRYMSPEQLFDTPIDQRSDLYSLGIVFYEMLIHEKPFDNANTIATIQNSIKNNTPKLPPEFKQYQPLLNKLITPQPDDRINTAEELLLTLSAIKKTPSRSLNPLLISSIFGVTLALLGGGFFLYPDKEINLFPQKSEAKLHKEEQNTLPPPPLKETNSNQNNSPVETASHSTPEENKTTKEAKRQEIEKELVEKQEKEWKEKLEITKSLIKNKKLKQAKNIINELLTDQEIPEQQKAEANKILSEIDTAITTQKAIELLGSIRIASNKKQAKSKSNDISAQHKVTIQLEKSAYLHCLYQSPPPEEKKMMQIFPPPKNFLLEDSNLKQYKKYKKRRKVNLYIGEGLAGTANIHCFATSTPIEKQYETLFKPDSNNIPYTKTNTSPSDIKASISGFSTGIYTYSFYPLAFTP